MIYKCKEREKEYWNRKEWNKQYWRKNKERLKAERKHADPDRTKARLANKKYYQKHREEIRAKAQYRTDEDRAKAKERYIRNGKNYLCRTPEWRRMQHLKNKYGLSLQEYNELLDVTGGTCPICKKPFDETKKPVIDHNHKTGTIRGIVCRYCNLGIGLLGDDTDILLRAIEYLKTE